MGTPSHPSSFPGIRLTEIRLRYDLTIRDFAKILDTSVQHASALEMSANCLLSEELLLAVEGRILEFMRLSRTRFEPSVREAYLECAKRKASLEIAAHAFGRDTSAADGAILGASRDRDGRTE